MTNQPTPPTYFFQCQRCFIVSGRMSKDPNDAPACCGGETMAALRVMIEENPMTNQPKPLSALGRLRVVARIIRPGGHRLAIVIDEETTDAEKEALISIDDDIAALELQLADAQEERRFAEDGMWGWAQLWLAKQRENTAMREAGKQLYRRCWHGAIATADEMAAWRKAAGETK